MIEMTNPKVSIIIPVYNAESTLMKCVRSVLDQDYQNIEIILINDGSSDGSEKVCESLEQKGQGRVIAFTQRNSGPSAARNKGIELSSGKYLAFVDADDYIDHDMISEMVQAAENHAAPMVICGYIKEDTNQANIIKPRFPDGLYEGDKTRQLLISLLLRSSEEEIPPFSWVRIILKSALADMKFDEKLMRSEDFHLWTRVHAKINRVYLLGSRPFYHYVENSSSITHNYVKGYSESIKYICSDLMQRISSDEEMSRVLNTMFVMRSLLALNNAVLCDHMAAASREIWSIVNDSNLKKTARMLYAAGEKKYRTFVKLMSNHGQCIVYMKYMEKWAKNRKKGK